MTDEPRATGSVAEPGTGTGVTGPLNLHGGCVSIEGAGVLITGVSGSGKSDLALRLIGRGARLVADDRTELRREGRRLMARPPDSLAGLLEVRGLGLVSIDWEAPVEVRLVVELVPASAVERMPHASILTFLGLSVVRTWLAPFEVSAVEKVHMAMAVAQGQTKVIR